VEEIYKKMEENDRIDASETAHQDLLPGSKRAAAGSLPSCFSLAARISGIRDDGINSPSQAAAAQHVEDQVHVIGRAAGDEDLMALVGGP
jgi:hypothetical protein